MVLLPLRMLFLSTLSLRRATSSKTHDRHKTTISIHALLAESDISVLLTAPNRPLFLSTLSLRRATYTDLNSAYGALISIHALLAESDVGQKRLRQKLAISIHALLAESDMGLDGRFKL